MSDSCLVVTVGMTPRHTPRVNTSEGCGIFGDAEGVELPECRQHRMGYLPRWRALCVALRPAYTTMSRFHLYPLQSDCPQGGLPTRAVAPST